MKRAGHNQKALAALLGVHKSTVCLWLQGKREPGKQSRNGIRRDELMLRLHMLYPNLSR